MLLERIYRQRDRPWPSLTAGTLAVAIAVTEKQTQWSLSGPYREAACLHQWPSAHFHLWIPEEKQNVKALNHLWLTVGFWKILNRNNILVVEMLLTQSHVYRGESAALGQPLTQPPAGQSRTDSSQVHLVRYFRKRTNDQKATNRDEIDNTSLAKNHEFSYDLSRFTCSPTHTHIHMYI